METHTSASPIVATRAAAVPRSRVIAYWIVTAIVLLETIVGAQWDLARNAYVTDVFRHLGYPLYLLTILGVAKGLAAAALLVPRFPRLTEWAYAGLFFVYGGAVSSHVAVGDGPAVFLAPAIFAAFTLMSHALRPQNSTTRWRG